MERVYSYNPGARTGHEMPKVSTQVAEREEVPFLQASSWGLGSVVTSPIENWGTVLYKLALLVFKSMTTQQPRYLYELLRP